jgi:hypothetical protein
MGKFSITSVAIMVLAGGLIQGCYSEHKIESTHEIKPIHITIDINVKVDRALNDFFGDLDEDASEIKKEQKIK